MINNRYVSLKGKAIKRFPFLRRVSRTVYAPLFAKKLKKLQEKPPLFQEVEIETVNRCNGKCSFCPVNANAPQRPYAKMTDELFERIINQLGELEYSGKLSLFSNNEPFLDQRIMEFARLARQRCPKAFIEIFTNGLLLTREKIEGIMPYLDMLLIDNYSDALELNEGAKQAEELCQKTPELNKKIIIELRKQNEVLQTRGGQSPNNRGKVVYRHLPCLNPFTQLVIRPNGGVSLCCNDALGKVTLGDCNTESLLGIWNGENYKRIRDTIAEGRENFELCRYCDFYSRNWLKSKIIGEK